jgi:hypothetical protein
MKYLEELNPGDSMELNNEYYIVTSDFKNDGSKMCVSLKTGFCRYLKPDAIVNSLPLYFLDKESNVVPIKPILKEQI